MLNTFLFSFTSIFVALDIIGAIPVYISMTRHMNVEERNKIVNTSMGVALLVAVIFCLVGQTIFAGLGISISDFKVAGGLVLLLIALADLLGGPEVKQNASGSTGIVPLAVPLISGPGVLAAVVLQAGTSGYLVVLAALFANYAIAWVLLRRCAWIQKVIGKDGTVAVSKIAALLLAAIAVSMIRSGLFEAIRAFHF